MYQTIDDTKQVEAASENLVYRMSLPTTREEVKEQEHFVGATSV